jgi:Prolyl oligopeptidase family
VLFFVLGTDSPGREGEVYAAMQRCWAAAAALLDPVFTRVEIAAKVRFPDPTGGSAPVTRSINLPAYLALAPGDGAKPTVIINNGSDAQLIDVYAYGAAAALERGYNALIFEGPGQGSLLFEQNIAFTPYWQDVVTPLVDYLVKQPKVDAGKLALTGWSFGGLLVFRAAAYEHRLAAVVGDPGYVDNLAPWAGLKGFVQEFTKGDFTNENWKTTYDHLPPHGATAVTQPEDVLPSQPDFKFLVGKRGEIYDSGYHTLSTAGKVNPDLVGLFAKIGAYSADAALLAQVRSHVLIAQYEGDSFFGTAQGTTLHDQLTGAASRTTRLFTAAEGAQEHCAPLAPQVRNEAVFDWLDDTFAGKQIAPPLPPTPSSGHSGTSADEIAIAAGSVAVIGAVAVAALRRRTHPQDGAPVASD